MKTALVKEAILEIFKDNGNRTMTSAGLYAELIKVHDVSRSSFNITVSKMARETKLYRVSNGHYQAVMYNS